jgi:8-oxo-dGTP diphosphatase
VGLKVDYKYCPQCRRPMTRTAEGDPHCDHCDITMYNNVAAAACVLPIRDGKVLLARRAREPYKGDYDFIGGFMKTGETPEQAAIRETKEETGLDIKLNGLLGMYADKYGDGASVLGIDYLAEIATGDSRAADDVAALEWVEIDNLPPAALQSGFKSIGEALRDLQAWYHKQAKS